MRTQPPIDALLHRPPTQPPTRVDRARGGDSAAFDALFRELGPSLRAFAAARGADDPDGIVNDSLAEAFRALPRFTGDDAAFRGFVFHIARRRLIDGYRRRGRRLATVPLASVPDVAALGDPAVDATGSALALELVNGLTADQRDVILLRVLCDLSLAETAAALDKPLTAVKALQRRGLAALRRKIEQAEVSK